MSKGKQDGLLRKEYEKAHAVKIEVALIPNHVRGDLAAATLAAVQQFLRQPGGREFLDTKIAAKECKA